MQIGKTTLAIKITAGMANRSSLTRGLFERLANLPGHFLLRAVWTPGGSRNEINSLWAVDCLKEAGTTGPNSAEVPFKTKLSKRQFTLQNIAEQYDCLLVDQAGVIGLASYTPSECIFPWAGPTLQRLAEMGKTIVFLSNVADRSPEYVVEKIKRAGFIADPELVFTSGQALSMILKPGEKVFLVGSDNDPRYNQYCTPYITATGATLFDPAVDTGQPDRVVICFFDKDQNLTALQKAIEYARQCPREDYVILANPDRLAPTDTDQPIPVTGMAAEYLDRARIPYTLAGKPGSIIYRFALEKMAEKGLRFPKKRILMIGDTLETDILGAANFGIDSLLVLSGNHRNASLDEFCRLFTQVATPNYVLRRFSFD